MSDEFPFIGMNICLFSCFSRPVFSLLCCRQTHFPLWTPFQLSLLFLAKREGVCVGVYVHVSYVSFARCSALAGENCRFFPRRCADLARISRWSNYPVNSSQGVCVLEHRRYCCRVVPEKVEMLPPVVQTSDSVVRRGSIWVACVRKCLCRVVGVCADAPSLFFCFVCVCVCVSTCVRAIFVAFVTKHPRCRADSAGRRRKGRSSCAGSVSALLHRCSLALPSSLWRSSSGPAGGIPFMAQGWGPFKIFSYKSMQPISILCF